MITGVFIIVIVIISIVGFHNKKIYSRLIFNPDKIKFRLQLYRYISHSFIHRTHIHLIINMFTLLIFGLIAEKHLGSQLFLCFFLMASIFSVIPYYRKKFNIVGCSGAISSVIFFVFYLTRFFFGLRYFIWVTAIMQINIQMIQLLTFPIYGDQFFQYFL